MLFGLQAVDFVYQHDGVFDHHADQAHHADDGHKGQWLSCQEQRRGDAAEDEREAQEDEQHLAPAVEQQKQDSQNQKDRQRQILHQVADRFTLQFAFAYPTHRIAVG